MNTKNIIITGSEGLIGSSFRNYAEKKGYNLFCLDKITTKRKNYFKCDITNESQVKKIINKIFMKNKIDLLINNASANPSADKKMKKFKFTDYKLDNWKKNLEVDLIGSFLVSKYCLKFFEKNNNGNIINISSIYAIVGPDQKIYSNKNKIYYGQKPLEYSVSKAGILGFTKSLAAFYAGSNIKINALILGGVKNKQSKLFLNNYNKKTILNKMADLNEYNEYIDFFGSSKNSYMSGSCVVIDGGATNIL